MKHKIYLVLVMFLIFGKLNAQQDSSQTFSFSLAEAQTYALENSYDIKNKQIDIEISQKQIWQTTAIGLPQVKLKGSWQYTFKVPEMVMGGFGPDTSNFVVPVFNDPTNPMSGLNYLEYNFMGYSDTLELGLKSNISFDITVTQIIFSGEYIVGLQAAKVYSALSEISLEKSQKDLKETIAQSYYLVLAMKQNVEIIDSSYTNIKKIAAEMEQMYKTGYIEETDVIQMQLTALTIENSLNSLKRLEQVSERMLKFQLGISFNNKIVLTDDLSKIIEELDLEALVLKDFSLQNSTDYKLLLTQEQLANLSLKREQSKYLPTIVAFYNHNEKLNTPAFDFSSPDMFGVSLEWNLFTSGLRHTTIQQRKLEVAKIENSVQQVELALSLEYETALNTFITAQEAFINNKKNLEFADKIYKNTIIKYKAGMSSSLDITQTQNQYLTSQSNYFQSVVDLLNAKATLDKLLNN